MKIVNNNITLSIQKSGKSVFDWNISQFLPDDDEAASLFTIVIDKEITQQEKKKRTATATGIYGSFFKFCSHYLPLMFQVDGFCYLQTHQL